jgi:hypothetical protein
MQIYNWSLWDGPERQSLERRALEFSLKEKVTFAGEVPHACFWHARL